MCACDPRLLKFYSTKLTCGMWYDVIWWSVRWGEVLEIIRLTYWILYTNEQLYDAINKPALDYILRKKYMSSILIPEWQP